MKRLGTIASCSALALLLAQGPARGQERFDAPLGGARAPEAAPPVAPPTATPFGLDPLPLERPRLDAGCDLSGDWRVEGEDATAGPFRGVLRLAPLGPAEWSYSRQVSSADLRAAPRFERGRARIVGDKLYLLEEPSGALGLDSLVTAPGVEGPAAALRRAVYRLDLDGLRLEGLYRVGAVQGRERLSRGGPGAADNQVTLLVDGGETFAAFRAALTAARERIHFQTFIFRDDATGESIAAILKERARAGVKVRVLVDAVGDEMGPRFERSLREGGVELVLHHSAMSGLGNSILDVGRSIWGGIKRLFGGGDPPPREKRGVLNHDHRKILVVDGRVGFCGGLNVGKEYESVWHDVHARVEGSAVAELERLFLDRWRAAGGEAETPPPTPEPAAPPGDMSVDVVAALPGISQAIKARYLREVDRARARVLVENAYFLEDDVIGSICRSAGRGVRNVVIIPADPTHDVKIVRDAFAFVANDVVRAGVELYKYDGRMTHSKVAVFDGRVATVGSSNLDSMALTKLAECNLFVNDHRFARTLEERVFVTDLPRCTRQVVRPLSWWEKLKGGTLHLARSFL